MFSVLLWASFLAAGFSVTDAVPQKRSIDAEAIGQNTKTVLRIPAPVLATIPTLINKITVLTNTTSADPAVPLISAVAATTVKSTILILARDSASAYSAISGLNGIGIPYELLIVPQAGVTLPTLNGSATGGNYGGIVVLSEVSYNYGSTLGFQSSLSASQWASLYQYQISFGVRMVRLDSFPGPGSGTSSLGGCCETGVEQLLSISNDAAFPKSGLIL